MMSWICATCKFVDDGLAPPAVCPICGAAAGQFVESETYWISPYCGGITMLKVGEAAPDFTLPGHIGGKITLSGYRGVKNVVLAFYPLDWTPV